MENYQFGTATKPCFSTKLKIVAMLSQFLCFVFLHMLIHNYKTICIASSLQDGKFHSCFASIFIAVRTPDTADPTKQCSISNKPNLMDFGICYITMNRGAIISIILLLILFPALSSLYIELN